MRLLRRRDLPPAPDGSTAPPREPWEVRALRGMDALWLKLDGRLRVVDASSPALAFFGKPELPQALINVCRAPLMEEHARNCGVGPAEVELAHFDRTVRVWTSDLGEGEVFLHLEDLTQTRHLEAVRTDFVANLAHELRTPIASLSLAVETLSSDLSASEQKVFVRRVAEETAHIDALLKAVTELALLEGDVHLSRASVDLGTLVGETWRRVTDRQGPGILDNRVSPSLVIEADRVRLAEILQNLLENAHRYSPPGSSVTVEAIASDQDVTISVLDCGPGIPPAEIGRIFERFYKVDRARTRLGDGSGLGLAIARQLVSAHGGRIWAEAGEARGTRVLFTLAQPGAI